MSCSGWWAFAMGWLAVPALAATIVVGPPPASIQVAINTASSGDTVQISAGTYIQEVQVISKSINIVGAGQGVTIIQAPGAATHLTQFFTFGANYWTIVMVDNQAAPTPQTVNISDLTVDGGTQQDALGPFYGSTDSFSRSVTTTPAARSTTSTRPTRGRRSTSTNSPAAGIVNASSAGAVTFSVTNSLVDFYQRSGLDLRGATLTATISNSVVNRGYVLTPNTSTATPNGIQYSGGAGGSILNNLVAGNISTVAGSQATGMLPFGAGTMTITGNTVNDNDLGIVAISSAANLTISNNTLNFTTTPGVNSVEGIVVQDTPGLTTLSANVMNNIPDVNMDLASSTNQPFSLSQNRMTGSKTGLLITGNATTGPMVTMNADVFTGTTGYYIQEVAAPNDVWPSTASVTFDGLRSGLMTLAQFNTVLTKIFDKHNDPALGLVLDFIPPSPPTVVTVTPPSGPAAGGTIVTITGTNFVAGGTSVFFGGVAATTVVVNSDTSLTVTVPPGTGVVDIRVTTTFGTVTVPAAYTYAAAPVVAVVQIPVDSWWMLTALALGLVAGGFAQRTRLTANRGR